MKFLAVSKLTFRELLKNRLIKGFVIAQIVITFLSYYLSNISSGDNVKIAMDFIIASVFFFFAVFTILVAVNSMDKDINDKVVYLIFSKPVNRRDYFIGKLFGFSFLSGLLAFLSTVLMTISFYLINYFSKLYFPHEIMPLRIFAFGFSLFLLGAFLMAVVLVLSFIFSNITFVPVLTFFIFLAGLEISAVKDLAVKSKFVGQFNKMIIKTVYYIWPNFSLFSIRDAIVYKDVPFSFLYISGVFAYTCCFLFLLTILGIFLIERKEF